MKKALMCEYLNGLISLNNICGTKLSDYKTCQWFKMNSRKKIWGNTRTLSRAYWNCFYPLTPKSVSWTKCKGQESQWNDHKTKSFDCQTNSP